MNKSYTNAELAEKESHRKNQVMSDFNEIYELSTIVQKPFWQAVWEIIDMKGLSVREAAELTGLNVNTFYVMKDSEYKSIALNQLVSICIGFNLDSVSTQLLLQAGGHSLNMSNRLHRAYLYIIEYYKDCTIKECNKILEYLDIPEIDWLGAYNRGIYKPRNSKN